MSAQVSCVENKVCVAGQYFNSYNNTCYNCPTGCETCSLKNPTADDGVNPVLKCDKCSALYAFAEVSPIGEPWALVYPEK
jgi:hypothetical protein